MPQRTLFQFLTRTQISPIPLRPGLVFSRNTRSDAYPLDGVNLGTWNLTYRDITQSRYADILFNTSFTNDLNPSLPKEVGGEGSVQERLFYHVIKRLNRALGSTEFPMNHSQIEVDVGDAAELRDSNGKPDCVSYTGDDPHRVLRVPGDVKCSWKYRSEWIYSQHGDEKEEVRAVTAQINYYMNQARTKYGYIITNTELVLFRKREGQVQSYVEMAPGIPLSRYDSLGQYDIGPYTTTHGRITALLGLWYIHLLAADDNGWELRVIYSDPEDDEDDSGTYVQS